MGLLALSLLLAFGGSALQAHPQQKAVETAPAVTKVV